MKKVLFSPIGATDPVKYFHDGAMIHICRHYLPDKVVLYLSKEMAEHQDADHRYTYCLEKLGERLNHPFECEIIRDDEMEEVQVFDTFVNRFRDILKDIQSDKNVEEIYVNVSSGSPAMKSSLLMLSVLSGNEYKPIQVATPMRSQNKGPDEKESLKVEEYWQTNADNLPDALDRTTIASKKNWSGLVKEEIIKKHIESYNYIAALQVARDTDDMKPDFMTFLEAADARLKLDWAKSINLLNDIRQNAVIPISKKTIRPLLEYVLSLNIKIKKEEFADFVRALSPIMLELYERITIAEFGINVEKDLAKPVRWKKGEYRWDRKKIEKHPRIRRIFEDAYQNKPVYGNYIGNDNMFKLLNGLLKDEKVKKVLYDLHKVESKIRNQTAHQIDAVVTADSIKEKVGMTPDNIMAKIQFLMERYLLDGRTDVWDSYDKMNERLLTMLRG